MQKITLLLLLAIAAVFAKENIRTLQYTGVKVNISGKTLWLERKQNSKCSEIAMTPQKFFGGDMVNTNLPKECMKTIPSSFGAIQPIEIDPKIKTVGELEVLSLIQKAQQNSKKFILVDARKQNWYEYSTIPTAVNIPYNEIMEDGDFPEDHVRMLKLLQITKTKFGYDFSKAKKAILFCNGSWCVQSSRAIRALMKLGYPKEKLFWYRGGLQDWIGLGFPKL